MGFKSKLRQKAVYWAATPGGDGGLSFGAPQQLDCRWEDKQSVRKNKDGSELVCSAIVYLADPVVPGNYLKLGALQDIPAGADPATLDGAFPIRDVDTIPNVKATENLIMAYL